MTLQQLLDALAVARHGSVHGAARATGQTQPALTRSLRRLEDDLGAPLFERHARGVRATPAGRQLLEHAQRIATEAERARDAVAQIGGGRGGRIVYGISAAASLLLAPGAVLRFHRQYPGVALASRSGLSHSLAPLLRDGELEFAIFPTPPGPADPQFDVRPLLESQIVMVARRDHPQARAKRLADVADAAFVTSGPRGQPGGSLHALFESADLPPPRVVLQTDGLIDALAMVAGGDCLALLPAGLLRSGLVRDSLVRVPIADRLASYSVGLFLRHGAPLAPAVDELVRQFEREAHYQRRQGAGG